LPNDSKGRIILYKGTFKLFAFVLLVSLIIGLCASRVGAQTTSLNMDLELHYPTYSIAGTCVGASSHVFAMADIDGDGDLELITGGFAYDMTNGTKGPNLAPLYIWSWSQSSSNLTIEAMQNWTGNIRCVYTADADSDHKTEIITTGSEVNTSGTFSNMRFWNWGGQNLVLRGDFTGVPASSVSVADVDKDGKLEVVTVGAVNITVAMSRLSVWRWNGSSLTLKSSVDLNGSVATSVYCYDLYKNGQVNIITSGYSNILKNSSGQLQVWQMTDGNLFKVANDEWRNVDGYAINTAGSPQGNTVVNDLKVGDVDGDGIPEILTCGFTYDGKDVLGQLRIWNLSDATLNLETTAEWKVFGITEAKSVSIGDINNDGKNEIMTGGITTGSGNFASNTNEEKERGELRIWTFNGIEITLLQSPNWLVDQGVGVWSVANGDVDKDGVPEIITVGCEYFGGVLCDPDLRIWSISGVLPLADSFPYVIVSIIGLAAATCIVAAFFFLRKERRRTSIPI
jgi:hypothetical protein